MSSKTESMYYYGGHYVGRYIYITNPHSVKYEPMSGITIDAAADAMINLVNQFKANVNMVFNDIKFDIPYNSGITKQDIINKYFEQLKAR